MATNHTTNYNLNLWEPSDNFVREEFNENTNKIEAALVNHDAALATKVTTDTLNTLAARVTALENKSRFTKLKEFVNTERSSFLQIYLNDINWAQWDKVHVEVFSGQSGNYYFFNKDAASTNDAMGYLFCSGSNDIWSPRMTFHVGFQANRYVNVTCGSNQNIFGMTYPQAVKMVYSGAAIGVGAKYVFWGEK